jgi:ELWxxDGT repeat protein
MALGLPKMTSFTPFDRAAALPSADNLALMPRSDLSPSLSLLFIDAGVDDSQILLKGVAAGTEVHRLDRGQDAIAQITQTLLGRSGIASLQIISHGRSGGLQLGESWLDLQTLPSYVNQLKSWGAALSADADILLYGCNVAAGAVGRSFVDGLAQVTGADVAASDDLTGNAALGGDWDLEVKTGRIESTLGIAVSALSAYRRNLDLIEDPTAGLSYDSVYNGSVAWGDYSGDGKLDLIITGLAYGQAAIPISRLYKNNGDGQFTVDNSLTLPDVSSSSVAWGDYSGDGKLDLIITGSNNLSGPTSKLYKNDGNGGLSEDTNLILPGVYGGSVAWGDYSGDGKLDLILTGLTIVVDAAGLSQVAVTSQLYKNNGNGGLTEDLSIPLPGLSSSSVAWGDYSGDGKLDLIITGYSDDGTVQIPISKLYKNNGVGGLTEDTSITLPAVYGGSVAWGDYSGDGNLDLILTGYSLDFNPTIPAPITKVYKNNGVGGLTEDTSSFLPGVAGGSVAWGDYSGDGKLDLILTGYNSYDNTSILYKNDGNGVLAEDFSIDLPQLSASSAAWGDYSGDGKLDLYITGAPKSGNPSIRPTPISKLYKNGPAIPTPTPIFGPRLVKDINPGHGSSSIGNLTNVNGTLFFTTNKGIQGLELWKSDGTASGTVLIKDTFLDSSYLFASNLTNVNGTLYFLATDVIYGNKGLWKSDGTDGGTVLVKSLNLGIATPDSSLFNLNGTLYFQVDDGIHGAELWKSDGTANGTVLLKDINAGSGGSAPSQLTNVNGTIYFAANDGIHGIELWKSDGTERGTVLVKDINPGVVDADIASLTNVNGIVYFTAYDRGNQPRSNRYDFPITSGLWKSDGTATGTVLVRDMNNLQIGAGSPIFSQTPYNLTAVNETLYFAVPYRGYGGLWKSDGTTAGTAPIPTVELDQSPSNLTNVNGTLYFTAKGRTSSTGLWKSDGTATGTVRVQNEDRFGKSAPSPSKLTNVNGLLYFTSNDLDYVNYNWRYVEKLWKSDGTDNGTVSIQDIGYYPVPNLINVNGTLYYIASDRAHGSELWAITDDSPSVAVSNLNAIAGASQSFPNWAKDLTQAIYPAGLSYVVTVDRPELFAQLPTIAPNGKLTYELKPNANANPVVNLTIQLKQADGTIGNQRTTATLTIQYLDPTWKVTATADFNRDDIADILLHNQSGDEVSLWLMAANGQVMSKRSLIGQDGQILRTKNPNWQVVGFADIDRDNILDIVWRNQQSDEVGFWFMTNDGKTVKTYDYLRNSDGTITKTNNSLWQIAAVADFDRDGNIDLLFRLPELNQTAIVRMNGKTFVDAQYISSNADTTLQIRGIADSNGDRVPDIYWQSPDKRKVLVQPIKFQGGRWLTDDFAVADPTLPLAIAA